MRGALIGGVLSAVGAVLVLMSGEKGVHDVGVAAEVGRGEGNAAEAANGEGTDTESEGTVIPCLHEENDKRRSFLAHLPQQHLS